MTAYGGQRSDRLSVAFALGAAALFGLSPPAGKALLAVTAPPGEPHSHRHSHELLRHSHPHYPDIHHRHGH